MPLTPAQEEHALKAVAIAFMTVQAPKHLQTLDPSTDANTTLDHLQAIAIEIMAAHLLQLLDMPPSKIEQKVQPYYQELTGETPPTGTFEP